MKKNDIIKHLADASGVEQKTAKAVLESLTDLLVETVRKGEKFTLPEVGIFSGVARAARDGRNPMTGEKIHIAATVAPKFAPAKAFKDALTGAASEGDEGQGKKNAA